MGRMVGVDIGATAVRVVEVRGLDSKGYAIVSRLAVAPLREGAVVGGRVRNHVVVSQALIRALRQAGVGHYGFVVGLSSPDAAVAHLQLPAAVRPGERVKAIRTLDRQISPTVPLSEASLSTNVVRTDVTGEGHAMTTLCVAAALQSEVDSLLKLMKLSRCQPRAIDLSGAATMRALVRTTVDAAEVHTVVDVGATKTTITTRQGLHLRSIRSAPTGGDLITRVLMQVTGDDFETAERRKAYLRLPSAAAHPVVLDAGYGADDELAEAEAAARRSALDEALVTAGDELVETIAGSIEADAMNHANSFTQGVVLCGGTAQLGGLKERLHQRVGVPVQIGRPWAVLERSKQNLVYFRDGVEDPRLMMSLTTAIGLALWKERP